MQSQPVPGYNPYNPQQTVEQISPQHSQPAYTINSGPQEWSQNWVDVWNFALEDVYSERPSFCKTTTFDSLQQEFYSF